jgi:hypothetical protein
MQIPINDHDALKPQVTDRPFGCDRKSVEQTKAHGPVGFCVVPWGPNQTETIIDLTAFQPFDAVDGSTGSHQGRLVGIGGGSGVGVKIRGHVDRRGSYRPNQFRAMVELNRGDTRLGEGGKNKLDGNFRPFQFPEKTTEPIGRFEVIPSGVMGKKKGMFINGCSSHKNPLTRSAPPAQ